jgi:NAD(P)-dependent dehydrogenase (short-subunit alcohol dehydrogenase family)
MTSNTVWFITGAGRGMGVEFAKAAYAGFFEELSQEQIERQVHTNLFGPMNVTRAVLPVMRKQRSGHVVTLSSMAGLVGQAFCSAYAASKFGVEGWMESIRFEIEPFGIRTTIVEPGFFRTVGIPHIRRRFAGEGLTQRGRRSDIHRRAVPVASARRPGPYPQPRHQPWQRAAPIATLS